MNLVHQWAVRYARQGIAVIPMIRQKKRPLIRWKTYRSVMPTEEILATWFATQFPDANLTAVLGRHSNLFAVDVEGLKSKIELGTRALREAESRLGGPQEADPNGELPQ